MAIDRRSLLLAMCAAAVPGQPWASQSGRKLYAAARAAKSGACEAAVFDANGQILRSIALPDRGHGIAVCPVTGHCVVFARRPETFAVSFSPLGDEVIAFATPPERHFYGHGVFSSDGRLLYATENDFEAGVGVIGVYDVGARYRRIGELPSQGVGPHDLALLENGTIMVVANGGYQEHPDLGGGRRILNPDSVETSLAYLDPATSDLIECHALPKGRLSLRHVGVAHDGTLVLGGQFERAGITDQPIVFRHRRGEELQSWGSTEEWQPRLAGYVSSVAIDATGEVAAVTSSRSGAAVFVHVATGRLLGSKVIGDVSGIAPSVERGAFVATSGLGCIALTSPNVMQILARDSAWQWDNHAEAL